MKILNNNIFIFITYFILSYILIVGFVDLTKIAIAPGDGYVQGVPLKIFTADFQMWNPYVQSGSYIFKDIGFQSLYLPGIIFMNIFPSILGYNLFMLFHYAFAGLFTYLFARQLNVNKYPAFITGLIFMFSGFMMGHKGHAMMVQSAIWLPLILFFIEKYFITKNNKFLIFAGISFSLSILADYLAIPMYIGMVILPYILFRSYNGLSKNLLLQYLKSIFKILLIVLGIGLLLASIQILPILESLPLVTRDKITYDFFSSYSFQIYMIPLMIFPYLLGTQSTGGIYNVEYYGGYNLTEMAGYIGLLPLILIIIALLRFKKNDSQIKFWLIIGFLAFIFVLGRNIPTYQLMFNVPIYNMFRASARLWFVVDFAVAIIAGITLNNLIKQENKNALTYSKKAIYIFSGIFSSTLIGVFIFRKILPFINIDKINTYTSAYLLNLDPSQFLQNYLASTSYQSPAIYIPTILAGLSILILYLFVKYKNKNAIKFIFALVIFIDLFSFGHFHDTDYAMNVDDFSNNRVYNYLLNNDSNFKEYRILALEADPELLSPNLNILYGINVVNGYGPVWLKDYKDLVGFEANGISNNYKQLIENNNALSLLATKYLLTKDEKKFDYFSDNSQYELVYNSENNLRIYLNKKYVPRVSFADELILKEDSNSILTEINKDDFLSTKKAIITDNTIIGKISNGKVIISDFSQNDKIIIEAETSGDSFLVISDSYYPGWSAKVDGINTNIIKTDLAIRGIFIKGKGIHKIELSFIPNSFYYASYIAIITLLVIIIYLSRPVWKKVYLMKSSHR